MKLSELKHNHSLTDLLKILIFSILMLTPLLSVACRCMYVICNKNAYQSYTGNQNIQNETSVINESLLQNNMRYSVNILTFIENTDSTNSGVSPTFYPLEQLDFTVYGVSQEISNQTTSFKLVRANTTYTNIFLYDNQDTQILNYSKPNTFWQQQPSNIMTLYFTLKNYSIVSSTKYGNYLLQYNMVASGLDNVFEYSISQLENSEYYNWTQSTAVYTGVKAMTTNLQIDGNVIPILITYWFLLTVIYVIIDIVLKCFTTLTHLIGNKKV